MLCIAGSWDEVIDRLEAFHEAGARTMVLRFAARDQLNSLEKCAAVLHPRRLLTDSAART
jgi:alkanesulfonate monooxygenase SsuD/methylene tetrahydromethanopterin reductase-like flavin-dependent oxidoreductase (luciferase family)